MRVLVTGGSGKAGRHVVAHLVARGHRVSNPDLVPLAAEGWRARSPTSPIRGRSGGALTQPSDWADLERPGGPGGYDAVVHFAAIPRIMLRTGNETFRVNTMGTYNMIEAAMGCGIRVIFASSETTYGICFAAGERKPAYIPVDEEHPTLPGDSYSMSKVVGEATARSFRHRSGTDIHGRRITKVIEPHEYAELFPGVVAEPERRRRNIFAYIDAPDLGRVVECCRATDGLGYEVFNVANPNPSVDLTSDEIAARFYAGVERRRAMAPDETFHAIDKARRLVGFAPAHDWRDELRRRGQGGALRGPARRDRARG